MQGLLAAALPQHGEAHSRLEALDLPAAGEEAAAAEEEAAAAAAAEGEAGWMAQEVAVASVCPASGPVVDCCLSCRSTTAG